jgi:uncharacterized protein YkwD
MRKTSQSIVLVLITGALASALSCTSPSTNPPATPPASAQKQCPRVAVPDLEKKIRDLVNKERRKHGLVEMRRDDALARIAVKHSRDMADNKYFGHTSPDGHGYAWRYLKNGYACGVTVDGVLRSGAENIYRLAPDSGEGLAEATVRGWLSNKEDRKNLLSSPWEREGIGICSGPDGIIYITMNFC